MGVRYSDSPGDIIGDNGITLVTKTHQRNGDWYADFICPRCGKVFNCRMTSVRKNRTKSCGCLVKEKMKEIGMSNKGKIGPTIKYQIGEKVGPYDTILLKRLSQEKTSTGSKAVFQCPFCGNSFITKPYYIATGHTISCGCISSKGEAKISSVLEEMGIDYVKQKTFDDCLSENGSLLRFDFFIPDRKILIEYDGEQHFNFRENGFFTEGNLIKIQERDRIKNEWTKNNSYVLKRISFLDYEKINVDYMEEILNV